MNLETIQPYDSKGRLQVIVESPMGTAVKLKYDPSTHLFVWSRGLPSGTTFPGDFGFVPQTLAGDGDALDVLSIGATCGYPGILIPARVIGALQIFQTRDGGPEKDNHRLLTVATNEHRFTHIVNPQDLGARLLAELEAFFRASLALTTKQIRIDGWLDADAATRLVATTHQAWRQSRE